jgi:hypothetical protein
MGAGENGCFPLWDLITTERRPQAMQKPELTRPVGYIFRVKMKIDVD